MREIKFRAWDHLNQEWLVGHCDPRLPITYNPSVWLNEDGSFSPYAVYAGVKLALPQYTGLKDKNGKEIYEGDIVADEDGDSGEVFYDVRHVAYRSISDDGITRPFIPEQDGMDHGVEVIGNIYENPELLEEKK